MVEAVTKPLQARYRTLRSVEVESRHPSPNPPHEVPGYEKTASSPQPSPPSPFAGQKLRRDKEEEREMRSGCWARAINRSLLTEFAEVRGFKVRNFISAKSLPSRGEGRVRGELAFVIEAAFLGGCAW